MARNAFAPQPPPPYVEVVSDPGNLGGMPVIHGTRIPAETVVAYRRDGYSAGDIVEDCPYIPLGGVEAVKRQAAT